MLNVSITPHREFLPADTPDQRLFIMLKLRPTREVAQTRPSTTFVFLIASYFLYKPNINPF